MSGRRAHGRGEVDAARRDQRARAALHRRNAGGQGDCRRARHRDAPAARAGRRRRGRGSGSDGRVRDRRGRRRAGVRDGATRGPAGRHAQARRGDARSVGSRRAPVPGPARDLRRPATAGRDRCGAHVSSERARARRTDLGARSDRGRGGTRRDHPARPRPRRHRGARRTPAGTGGAVRGSGRAHRRRRDRHRRHAGDDVRVDHRRATRRRARSARRLVAVAVVGT